MLTIHKTINGQMTKLDKAEDGCWVNLTYPTERPSAGILTRCFLAV